MHPWRYPDLVDPEKADLTSRLKLEPKRPFYSFSVDESLTIYSETDTAKIVRALNHVSPRVHSTFGADGGGRKFCWDNVMDIVYHVYTICGHYEIGEFDPEW